MSADGSRAVPVVMWKVAVSPGRRVTSMVSGGGPARCAGPALSRRVRLGDVVIGHAVADSSRSSISMARTPRASFSGP